MQLPEEEAPMSDMGDFTAEEFRRYGTEVVDWIANYLDDPSQYPVLSRVQPGEIRGALPASAPETGEPMEEILRDFESVILPGITHWNHPGFMAYFAITGSAPGILAEMLSAALNVNGMLWRTSPAATELEEVSLDWLRQMLGLPEVFGGVVYDTASISSFTAMAAARQALDPEVRRTGLAGAPPMRVYCSDQAHSSIEKAAIALGIGQDGVRLIPSDDEFRMRPSLLREAIERDIANGDRPGFVCATVGTTATTSIDPVPQIANICAELGVWLHVDAAYGGSAAILPELRWIFDGAERADSIVVNPHKWLFTPVDISVLYCRRLDVIREAFSLVPEYLQTSDEGVRNYMDYGVQLGRRFRALKLWFVLRAFGREGIAAHIREHLRLAQELKSWVEATPDWEIMAPVPFSTVCMRYAPPGAAESEITALNSAIMQRVNASGEIYLSDTKLRGRTTLRIAIGNIRTTEATVRRAWELLQEAAAKVSAQIG